MPGPHTDPALSSPLLSQCPQAGTRRAFCWWLSEPGLDLGSPWDAGTTQLTTQATCGTKPTPPPPPSPNSGRSLVPGDLSSIPAQPCDLGQSLCHPFNRCAGAKLDLESLQ